MQFSDASEYVTYYNIDLTFHLLGFREGINRSVKLGWGGGCSVWSVLEHIKTGSRGSGLLVPSNQVMRSSKVHIKPKAGHNETLMTRILKNARCETRGYILVVGLALQNESAADTEAQFTFTWRHFSLK